MTAKKMPERTVSRKHFGKPGEPAKSLMGTSNQMRLIRTSNGNSLIVLPGVKQSEARALFPSNWKNKTYYPNSGRMKKGQGNVFTAETVDSNGKKFRIQCRTIRRHYTTTHEARMLSYLRRKGFKTEQPLAIVKTPEGERILVTRYIERGSSVGNIEEVKKTGKKLRKSGIVPEDLYEYGRPNYLFVESNGKKRIHLIDVEHYYSKDRKSRLSGRRMSRK